MNGIITKISALAIIEPSIAHTKEKITIFNATIKERPHETNHHSSIIIAQILFLQEIKEN